MVAVASQCRSTAAVSLAAVGGHVSCFHAVGCNSAQLEELIVWDGNKASPLVMASCLLQALCAEIARLSWGLAQFHHTSAEFFYGAD